MKQCVSHMEKKWGKVSFNCGCQFPMTSWSLLAAATEHMAWMHPSCAVAEGPCPLPMGDRYNSAVAQVPYAQA